MNREPITKLGLFINDEIHELDASQLKKLNDWLLTVIDRIDQKNLASKQSALAQRLKEAGEVYAGVIGGNLTFSFTETGLGTVFKVKESVTGEIIDLSDYDNW